MCQICASLRPFDPDCALQPIYALIQEGVDAPASVATTYVMQPGDTFAGSIGFNGDQDWVRVTLEAGVTYEITLRGQDSGAGTLGDPYLRLHNASSSLIAENDDGGQGLESLIYYTPTTTGTYYVSAGAFGSQTGSYRMSVSTFEIGGNLGGSQVLDRATAEDMATYLTSGYWGGSSASWASGTITVNLSGLNATGQQLARWAMEAWSMVANVTFTEVRFGGNIVFTQNQQGAFAQWYSSGGFITSATVNVHSSWVTGTNALIGGYGFQTYVHEIGHALGLGHQGPYDGTANFGSQAIFFMDSWQATIMSYFSQNENPYVTASFAYLVSAQMVDILAAQSLYGAPGANSATAGNTVYGFNSNLNNYLGRMSRILVGQESGTGFYNGNAISFTIYDAGGNDTIDLSPLTSDTRLDLTPGSFSDVAGGRGNIGIAFDTIIENASTGSGHDHITGNIANNFLSGGQGNDTIYGEDGNDTLRGQDGNDVLHGGDGADRLMGGRGHDLLYGGAGADRLFGESGNDTIYGGNGFDTIRGGNGNDLLFGDAGNDLIYGGRGNDTIYGGAGFDVLDGEGGNDILYGEAGNDTLFGGAGNDVLYGGDGNDVLYAGTGRDTLFGGAGADVFVWTDANQSLGGVNRDTVMDFEVGVDLIDISAIHPDLVFVTSFSGIAGEVRFGAMLGRLLVDTTGDGVADFSIQFERGLVLTGADLIL